MEGSCTRSIEIEECSGKNINRVVNASEEEEDEEKIILIKFDFWQKKH